MEEVNLKEVQVLKEMLTGKLEKKKPCTPTKSMERGGAMSAGGCS